MMQQEAKKDKLKQREFKESLIMIRLKDGDFSCNLKKLFCTMIRCLLQETPARSNPFKRKFCEKDDCMVCCTEGKGPCDAHGAIYSITCTECINDSDIERVYIGETSLSAYTRDKEHLTSLSRRKE